MHCFYRHFCYLTSGFIYRSEPEEKKGLESRQFSIERLQELKSDIQNIDTLSETDDKERMKREKLLGQLQEEVTPDEFVDAWKKYVEDRGEQPTYEGLIDFVWRMNLPEKFIAPPESFWSRSEHEAYEKAERERIMRSREKFFENIKSESIYRVMSRWDKGYPRSLFSQHDYNQRAIAYTDYLIKELEIEYRHVKEYPLRFSNTDIFRFIKAGISPLRAKRWSERFMAPDIIFAERTKMNPAIAAQYAERFSGRDITFFYPSILPEEANSYPGRFTAEWIIYLHKKSISPSEASKYPDWLEPVQIVWLAEKGISGELAALYCQHHRYRWSEIASLFEADINPDEISKHPEQYAPGPKFSMRIRRRRRSP